MTKYEVIVRLLDCADTLQELIEEDIWKKISPNDASFLTDIDIEKIKVDLVTMAKLMLCSNCSTEDLRNFLRDMYKN